MSARTVEEVGDELARFMPGLISGPAAPLLGGYAASMQGAEVLSVEASAQTTIGGASDIWLDLIARGQNQVRQDGESDAALRSRLQHPAGAVTVSNIESAVNAILDGAGLAHCRIIEWFDAPYLSQNCWLDRVLISGGRSSFVVVVPVETETLALAYLDLAAYLDLDAFVGVMVSDSSTSAAYAAIVAIVNTLRAAGVRWALYLQYSGVYLA